MIAVDTLAKILWDYHHVHHQIKKADCIFILGSHDLNVARYGASLFLEGWAPLLAVSGGVAHAEDLLDTGWKKSEGEMFADIAIHMGVPGEKILVEDRAKNTGENFQFTEALFKKRGIDPKTVIIVQKPYMERRSLATGLMRWSHRELIVVSTPVSYEEYVNGEIPKDKIINSLVGDLQSIKLYGE